MKTEKSVEQELLVPPHSIEAERCVLAALMIETKAIYDVVEILSVNDYYIADHRKIYSAILDLHNSDIQVDVVTVYERLNKTNQMDRAVSLSYLTQITRDLPTALNVVAYAKIVKDKSKLRDAISLGRKIIDNALSATTQTADDILASAESDLFVARESLTHGTGPTLINAHELSKIVQDMDDVAHGRKPLGISTPFNSLNELTLGFQRSDLIIVGARPSMGKTSFALRLFYHCAMNQPYPAMLFSIEMPKDMILKRMLACESNANFQRVRSGVLEPTEWDGFMSCVKSVRDSKKFIIDDTGLLGHSELRSRARRIHREFGGISMILVDYLQLMKVDSPRANSNRNEDVSEISRNLKSIAKELNVPVIALSQLSRNLEQRQDKRPIMADLRDSGAIEQDADVIMFIYRDEVYNKNKSDNKGKTELIVAKQRNGPTDTVNLRYVSSSLRFEDSGD